MFELTFAPGAWGKIGRRIIYTVDRAYVFFFLFYTFCVTFAVMQVITAIFLKETLQSANSDNDIVIGERLQMKDMYIKRLGELFKEIDVKHSGHIGIEDCKRMLQDQRSVICLASLE